MTHIYDINDSRLDIFARLKEPQLKTFFEPEPGIFIAESINVILRALGAGYEPLSLLVDEKMLNDATVCEICKKIPMRESVDSLNVAAASAVAFWVLRANEQ